MGDRAMAEIKTTDGSLFFYTHWTGHNLVQQCKEALAKAQPRIGDDPYATKIAIDSLIETSGARDSETGAGIMLQPNAEDEYNGDEPSVVLDLVDGVVERRGMRR